MQAPPASALPCPLARFNQVASAYEAIIGTDIEAQMDALLSQRYERVVGHNNGVPFETRKLQTPSDTHRMHYVRSKVALRVDCEGRFSIDHGPRCLARYDAQGRQ